MNNIVNFRNIKFFKSAALFDQLPPDVGAEVAFAGRSNAGKSSALNTITDTHRLARTSKTPGRTQLINFFTLTEMQRLVDLPGYGFAKVPDQIKYRWEKTLTEYIVNRQCLKGIILLMDIRHPLKPFDWQMIEWTLAQSLPIHILLTKADKLKRGAQNQTLMQVKKELSSYEGHITIQLFSATQPLGVEQVHDKLNEWLEVN